MNGYDEWREKTGHDDHDRAPAQRGPSVQSDVIVPILQAVALALSLALLAGTVAVFIGVDGTIWDTWTTAGKWFVGSFVGGLFLTTWAFVYQHRRVVVDPLDRVKAQTDWLSRAAKSPADRPPPLVFRPLGSHRDAPPLLPDLIIENTAEALEPSAAEDVKALYDFIIRVWPGGDVTRRGVMDLGYSRGDWERYISGDPAQAGQETGRGWLARAGAVDLIGGKWQIVAPLDQVLSSNRELYEYASAKARLVRIGREGMGGDGRGQVNVPDGPSQAGGGE